MGIIPSDTNHKKGGCGFCRIHLFYDYILDFCPLRLSVVHKYICMSPFPNFLYNANARYSPIDGKRYDTFHNGTKVYIFPHAKAFVGRTNPDIGGFNLSRKAFNW